MKYFFIVSAAIFLIIYFTLLRIDYKELNPIQKKLAENIYKKWDAKIKSGPKESYAITDGEELFNILNPIEKIFVRRIFAIDPAELGFKGPFYYSGKPDKLTKINSVKFTVNGQPKETGIQYYPEKAYKDFLRMNSALKSQTGKTLNIDSGYRSPGRQAYLFFKYLVTSSKYSLKENARWIAMPGYSEHGNPLNTAADLVNNDGINGIDDNQSAEDFERLPEYKWLSENAANYNFYLSYPKNNKYGVAFEPWHWHWGR